MSFFESLVSGSNSPAAQQLARQFGLQPAQASAAIGALMPAVASGLKRNADADEAKLASALAGGRHEQYVDRPESLTAPETTQDGNAILGHIFGSKEVSREVAAGAAQKTGIDPAILKKMLPVVAALAMGALAKQNRSGAGTAAATGGIGGMLGSLLDRNKDGSAMDDVTGMLGGMLKRKQ